MLFNFRVGCVIVLLDNYCVGEGVYFKVGIFYVEVYVLK